MTFRQLEPGDEFTFRPDFDIWFTVDERPKVVDPTCDRMSVTLVGGGKSFAFDDARVMVRRWCRS